MTAWCVEEGDDGRGWGWYVIGPAGIYGNATGRFGPYKSEEDAREILAEASS